VGSWYSSTLPAGVIRAIGKTARGLEPRSKQRPKGGAATGSRASGPKTPSKATGKSKAAAKTRRKAG
jgi:hypothetical protein